VVGNNDNNSTKLALNGVKNEPAMPMIETKTLTETTTIELSITETLVLNDLEHRRQSGKHRAGD
jgi:hypothetical protein